MPAVPCWAGLTVRDMDAAQRFYGPLLGWEFVPGPDRWGPYVRATVDGVEVAGLSQLGADWERPVAWTTYFGIESADRAADGVRERGGTLAVGPLAFDAGRVALAADPFGATFGIWEGEPGEDDTWMSAPGAPAWIELRTADPFAAALFYGEVFRWDGRDPAEFEVRYEDERVVLRSEGRSVAALRPAHDLAPHWEVFFSVADTDATAHRATALGGRVLDGPADSPFGRVARLADPEGGRFSVLAPAR
ncbi:VOC family protein [Kitasatospora sp. NPDC004531]